MDDRFQHPSRICLFAMSRVVRLTVFCSVFLHMALAVNFMETFFRWASVGLGRTPPTFTRDVVRSYGFPAETYLLQTDDGYILHMTRIFGRGTTPFGSPKLPVLLMHGLLSSSDHWVTRGGDKDLPLLLARLGHDVWLGDWRGNTFSKGHRVLSTSDPKFWNITYFRRAQHDLPVFIDKVLLESKAPQLFYIGYSYGTTALMILGVERPEYQNKIKQAILLAPVGYKIRDMYPAIRIIVNGLIANYRKTSIRNMFELLPREGLLFPFLRLLCSSGQKSCMMILFFLFGQREENIDKVSFENVLPRLPSGASSLDVIYLAQIFDKGFRAYDYGRETNRKVYGRADPPKVRVEENFIPMALYYGKGDHLNSEQGVFELSNRLPNVTFVKRVSVPTFGHLDYMIGKNVKTLLYDDIINLIEAQS